MNKDKREGWLADVKVDEGIAIEFQQYSKSDYKIAKVKRITPTGMIVVGDYRFNPDGVYYTGGDWGNYFYLRQITDEIKTHILRKKIVNIISNNQMYLKNIPLEQLQTIYNMLLSGKKDVGE